MNKNLELISKKNDNLYNLILNTDLTENIELITAKDGNLTAKYNGKLVHSQYKPFDEAAKIISKYQIENKDFIILMGIGFGYYISEILEKKKDKAILILVEDNLEILKCYFENFDCSYFLDRDDVVILHSSQKYYFNNRVEEKLKIGIAPEYEIIPHKILYKLDEKVYNEIMERFKSSISNILVNTATIFQFSKLWHKNSFKNLKYFAESAGVNQFFNVFKDKPAIVISAGPSLDKNIKYLQLMKGKAVLIAVGTVLKKLLKENIKPDFVMSVDGGEPNWEHFRRVYYDDIPLVYEPMVNTKITKYHKGKKVVFVSRNIVGAWAEQIFGKKGFLRMGGSVAVTAFDFAVKVGANPVMFVGQDLAFSGGRTHVSSSFYEDQKYEDEKSNEELYVLEVEDIFGNMVKSDRKFYTFLEYFNRFISIEKENNPELRVIDCTEGGAKIDGTEIMMLRHAYHEFIKNSCTNADSVFENVFFSINDNENNLKLKKEKEDIELRLKEVLKTLKDAIKILNQIIDKKDYSKIKKLEKLEKNIKEEIAVSNLIRYISQPIISSVMKKTKKDLSEEELLSVNLDLYKGLKDSIEFNIECLEEVL